jgi:hypothetical protein
MAINYNVYNIQAEVVDLAIDRPKVEDAFMVDTNAWYWMTYTRASQCLPFSRRPYPYQTTYYPNYINAALCNGSRIYHSGLSLAELTHLIEKAEYEIYARANASVFPNPIIFDKYFRHDQAYALEHGYAVLEVEAAWAQVKNMAELLTINIDESTSGAALARLKTDRVDGYDLFILESMRSHGVLQVITDDGDYITVPGIQVFTANQNVIREARAQGRLITR